MPVCVRACMHSLSQVLDEFSKQVDSIDWPSGSPDTIRYTALDSYLARYQVRASLAFTLNLMECSVASHRAFFRHLLFYSAVHGILFLVLESSGGRCPEQSSSRVGRNQNHPGEILYCVAFKTLNELKTMAIFSRFANAA